MDEEKDPEYETFLWLQFCQEFLDSIAPEGLEGKYIGGLLPPAAMLQIGWGDYDCKVGPFGTLMSYSPNAKAIANHNSGLHACRDTWGG